AHLLGGGGLLGAAQRRDLRPGHALIVPARVAVGDDAVDDLDPGVGPQRDGAGGTEVHVVGVGGDHKDSLDLGVVEHGPNPMDTGISPTFVAITGTNRTGS